MSQTIPDEQSVMKIATQHKTLEHILIWGLAQQPPILIEEVIPQDEFTNDVIVRYSDLFLAYDVT